VSELFQHHFDALSVGDAFSTRGRTIAAGSLKLKVKAGTTRVRFSGHVAGARSHLGGGEAVSLLGGVCIHPDLMNSLGHGDGSREEEESQRAHGNLEKAVHLISRLLPGNDRLPLRPSRIFRKFSVVG
jgi:hypothetical protein